MASNCGSYPPLDPPPASPQTQPPTRPKALAHHRKPEPHRRTPPPLHPRAIPKVRPHHAAPLRLLPRRRRLLRRHGQALPQNPRRHLRLPPQNRRRKIHHLQLLRHHLVPYGPYWRQARKMCLMELFSARRLESYEYIRVEETKSLLSSLYKQSNSPVDLKDHLSTVSLNVISRMVLGKKYLDENVEGSIVTPEEFKKMLDELFLLSGVLNIGDSIPWIDFLDLQGYVKRMKVLSKKFDRFLEHVLDEHNARRKGVENYVAKDMVDVLLQFADDPTLEVKLERHGVKAFTQDLIAGGTESSAVTVEWAISELLRKPELFEKATEELDRVIGKERWVEEKDIPNLPYLDTIVKETMRMHPVAPMLVPRFSREDIKIAGYDIPKDTRVLVNVWTIGRDPEIWDQPNEFIPERFIGKNIDVKGQDFELLPFGTGRRMCPGYSLGLKVIQSSLANLLHGFKWKLPGDMKPGDLSMEEIFGLSTPKKIPLVAMAEPRLPAHLYDM
ncbi:Cytochrome P450 71A1 [Vitis vinifera]|uniref:Cytochrome P450 71A1 n=1 Tax=Vitis vinifera TaxID=29760 RepID=A0A438K6X0_VITVI|nr:Cytochrome P450 71A1 [Vitis vinifera]